MYPAENGDCFLISFGENNRKHILIDCGYSETYYNYLRDDLKELNALGEKINLFIITHIDEDHILGAIAFIKDNNKYQNIEIEEVWYNCYRHLQIDKNNSDLNNKEKKILEREIALGESYVRRESSKEINKSNVSVKQGSTLGALLLQGGYKWNKSFEDKAVSKNNVQKLKFGDITINILSPDDEKLERLKQKWLKELRSRKWNFEIKSDELFDDAFEFMMLMNEESQIDKSKISLKEKPPIRLIDELVQKEIDLDSSSTNGSSIAICINYQEKNLLFLADGHPDILYRNINKLGIEKFDLVKVPHHGSIKNMPICLSKLLKSEKFLFSTSGNKHNHPNIESLAKIVYTHKEINKEFYFNYETEASDWISIEEIKKNFNLKVINGNGSSPLEVFISKECK